MPSSLTDSLFSSKIILIIRPCDNLIRSIFNQGISGEHGNMIFCTYFEILTIYARDLTYVAIDKTDTCMSVINNLKMRGRLSRDQNEKI
jgi:hypothetical protein